MINTEHSPISIINHCEPTRHVFQRYGLSSKNITPLAKIDKSSFSDYDFFVDLLETYENIDETFINVFEDYNLQVLTDYLKRSHDYYLAVRLPHIERMIREQIEQHQQAHPVLLVLKEFFEMYRADLEEHFQEEEESVFPLASHLFKLQENPLEQESLYWIAQNKKGALDFIENHKNETSDLKEINSAFLGYNVQDKSFTRHELILKEFNDFQKDLKIHASIEDFVFGKKVHELLQTYHRRLN
jgi:regulator of cell morphogenesis and NO signaling